MKNRNIEHKDNWKTPKSLYDKLNTEFNFDFDPCPYSEGDPIFDGLSIEWGNHNYINPPYSRKLKELFVKKALEESKKGKLCVLLLPVSTSTALFHEVIQPNATEIRFVRGRISFEGINTKGERVGAGSKPMHDSMIVVFDNRKWQPPTIERMTQETLI
jgi:phage N-6-adenine-methyltransferase